MLCPVCGKSVDRISQVVSLCQSCEAAQPKKEKSEIKEAEARSLVSATFRTEEYKLAGFWLRVIASCIDGAVIYLLSLLVSVGVLAIVGTLFLISPASFLYQVLAGIFAFIITLFFIAFILPPLLESSQMQATIGKYLIGLRVTHIDGCTKIGFFNALFRSLIRTMFGLGCLTAGLTEKKQAVHDLICNTLVVKFKKVSPLLISTYLISSFLIIGFVSYFTRDEKGHGKTKQNIWTSDISTSPTNPSFQILEENFKKLDDLKSHSFPKIKLKISPPNQVSVPSPTNEPPAVITAPCPVPKKEPKELDESKLSEFDRRVLKNKKLKETGGR